MLQRSFSPTTNCPPPPTHTSLNLQAPRRCSRTLHGQGYWSASPTPPRRRGKAGVRGSSPSFFVVRGRPSPALRSSALHTPPAVRPSARPAF